MVYTFKEIESRQNSLPKNSELLKKGTYKIVNIVNNKFYVGSTADSFISRFKGHIEGLNRKKHVNPHLQASYNKYGKDNFVFQVTEIIEQVSLIKRKEQILLDSLVGTTGYYNISLDASAPMRGRKHTKETIEKMSKASLLRAKEIGENTRRCRTGTKLPPDLIEKLKIAARNRDDSKRISVLKSKEFREKQSVLHKGIKRSEACQAKMLIIVKSPEYRQKMSNIKKGVKPSEATKIKMSLARGSKKYIFIKDNVEHEIINFREFSRDYNLDRKIIRRIVKEQSSEEYKGWRLKILPEVLS
jgi:group I intron endonuclease